MERAEEVRNKVELNLSHLVDSEELSKGHMEEFINGKAEVNILKAEDEGGMRL